MFIKTDTSGLPWREEGFSKPFFLTPTHPYVASNTEMYVILDWTTSIFDNRKKRSIGMTNKIILNSMRGKNEQKVQLN